MLEYIVLILFAVVVTLLLYIRSLKKRFEEKVRRSSLTLSGKTIEKLAPFLERFPYDAHDMRWLGDPIDFVVFDGLSSGNPQQIVFTEMKSGGSHLSGVQQRIKELIERKRIKWEEFRVG